MEFKKKRLNENLNIVGVGKDSFTEGKLQNIIISEEQLTRLLSKLEKKDELTTIREEVDKTYTYIRESIEKYNISELDINNYQPLSINEQGSRDRNPGVAAAEGIENILDNIKRAYEYIKDSRTRKQISNALAKLDNFMVVTADAIASGRDQRAPRSSEDLTKPMPYPELDESEGETTDDLNECGGGMYETEEIDECGEGDLGDEVYDDMDDEEETVVVNLALESDLKKMKEVIKPIKRV